MKHKGVYRSRRVLTAEEAALLGKKALTKETGTGNYELAKQICERHLQEFERTIAEARGDHLTPLERFERKYGSPRGRKMGEIADFCAEEGFGDPFPGPPKPEREPVTFEVLLAAWELENTNDRTHRAKRSYMARFAGHLGHDDPTRVEPPDFAAFKETLLKQANAGIRSSKEVPTWLKWSPKTTDPDTSLPKPLSREAAIVFSPDGNRIGFPGWVSHQDWTPPSFFGLRVSRVGNVVGRSRGGPAEPQKRSVPRNDPSKWDPLRKATAPSRHRYGFNFRYYLCSGFFSRVSCRRE